MQTATGRSGEPRPGAGRPAQRPHPVPARRGNPTRLDGPLWRACSSERRLWHLTEITADPDDPKRTPRVKVDWAREQIERYGRDNPWVLVNVFGRFPPHSLDTLIGPDDCAEATRRAWTEADIATAPRLLGAMGRASATTPRGSFRARG